MALIQPLALALLAAGLVPVLLHLLVRRRGRRRDFPSLRFLQPSPARRLALGHLSDPSLLAARLVLFSLLALLAARPYVRPQAVDAQPRFRAVVLDRSASVAAAAGEALQAARRALQELPPGAQAAVVGYGGRARLLSDWSPPAQALASLDAQVSPFADDDADAGSGGSAHGAAALQALELLQGVPGRPELVWISDFRGGDFDELRGRSAEMGVGWSSVPVAQQERSNDAPAAVRIERLGGADRVRVWVDRFTPEGSRGEEIAWSLGPELPLQLAGVLSDGRGVQVRVAQDRGGRRVEVALQAGDGLVEDDTVSFVLADPEPLRAAVRGPDSDLVQQALRSARQVAGLQVTVAEDAHQADLLLVTDLALGGTAAAGQVDQAQRRGAAVVVGGAERSRGEWQGLVPGPLLAPPDLPGPRLDAVGLAEPDDAGQVLARFEDGSAAVILEQGGSTVRLGFPLTGPPRGPGPEGWFPGLVDALVVRLRPAVRVPQAVRPAAERQESALPAPQVPRATETRRAAWVDPVAQERRTGWARPLAWMLLLVGLIEGLLARRAGGWR